MADYTRINWSDGENRYNIVKNIDDTVVDGDVRFEYIGSGGTAVASSYLNIMDAGILNAHDKADANLIALTTLDGNTLKKDNTTAYIPAVDYNPATKLYADNIFNQSKTYADDAVAVLKDYTDGRDDDVLTDAKDYTDDQISGITIDAEGIRMDTTLGMAVDVRIADPSSPIVGQVWLIE